MKIATTKTIEVEDIVDVLCNKCGESCKGLDGPGFEGLIEILVVGGYGSRVLGDMNHYRFSVCERCLYAYFRTFKLPICAVDGLDVGPPITM